RQRGGAGVVQPSAFHRLAQEHRAPARLGALGLVRGFEAPPEFVKRGRGRDAEALRELLAGAVGRGVLSSVSVSVRGARAVVQVMSRVIGELTRVDESERLVLVKDSVMAGVRPVFEILQAELINQLLFFLAHGNR